MPLYTYTCEKEKCGHTVEEIFSVNNRPDEITCFHEGCDGKKKFVPFPPLTNPGRINFKVAGDNSASQPKRYK